MKNTIIFTILFSLGIILTATQVNAKKANSKSYKCISASNGKFLITDSTRTNEFELYGVIFPSKKSLKKIALKSNTKAKDLSDFLPYLNSQLNQYAGQSVKIKNNFGKKLWLEDANGKSINLEVVEKGFALPVRNLKRQYKKQFQKAKYEAIKNAAGIWILAPDNDPTQDIRIDYSSRNIIKDKKSSSHKYSASSYTKNKSWNNLREITFDFNTFDLKRKIDLVIKYQFKLTNHDGKRNMSWSNINKKNISLFPPDDIKIMIKSPEVSMRKYSNSDAANSSVSGKDYAGDAVVIYYKDEIIFKRGDLK